MSFSVRSAVSASARRCTAHFFANAARAASSRDVRRPPRARLARRALSCPAPSRGRCYRLSRTRTSDPHTLTKVGRRSLLDSGSNCAPSTGAATAVRESTNHHGLVYARSLNRAKWLLSWGRAPSSKIDASEAPRVAPELPRVGADSENRPAADRRVRRRRLARSRAGV